MFLETTHDFIVEDSRLVEMENNSIDLVVTSPPYPMIEMWDEIYGKMNEDIKTCLEVGQCRSAFDMMHKELNKVWKNLINWVKPQGLICINIGDATRKFNGDFQMFPNRDKIVNFFRKKGYKLLPEIVWSKPSNSLNKFMGSGMLPSNAYVTHEHEFILIFRKNGTRSFEAKSDNRYESAYFWEERNEWFSDIWNNIHGIGQDLGDNHDRDRSGAYPLDIPYRLVNMFSVYGDTVLDPFAGVGTTTLASMVAGRNSKSIDFEPDFLQAFKKGLDDIKEASSDINSKRLEKHRNFCNNNETGYQSDYYDFGVKTKQEKQLKLYKISDIKQQGSEFKITHTKQG